MLSPEPTIEPSTSVPACRSFPTRVGAASGRSSSSPASSYHAVIAMRGSTARRAPVRRSASRSTMPSLRYSRDACAPSTRNGSTATSVGSSFGTTSSALTCLRGFLTYQLAVNTPNTTTLAMSRWNTRRWRSSALSSCSVIDRFLVLSGLWCPRGRARGRGGVVVLSAAVGCATRRDPLRRGRCRDIKRHPTRHTHGYHYRERHRLVKRDGDAGRRIPRKNVLRSGQARERRADDALARGIGECDPRRP